MPDLDCERVIVADSRDGLAIYEVYKRTKGGSRAKEGAAVKHKIRPIAATAFGAAMNLMTFRPWQVPGASGDSESELRVVTIDIHGTVKLFTFAQKAATTEVKSLQELRLAYEAPTALSLVKHLILNQVEDFARGEIKTTLRGYDITGRKVLLTVQN